MARSAPRQLYDRLANDYHLIFADWHRSMARQAAALDGLIRTELGGGPHSVLDCTCGIGTQALGLASRGYRVHATDLSAAAVARARREAQVLGLSLTFGVADIRSLAKQVPGAFDVVLSCDNSLPHLLSAADVHRAVVNMRAKLLPDGLLLASIRDYDLLIRTKPPALLPNVLDDPAGRRIVFQVWDWAPDGRTYTFHLFILRQTESGWHTAHYTGTYRPLLRAELTAALVAAGFVDLRWRLPPDGGYVQPVITARKH